MTSQSAEDPVRDHNRRAWDRQATAGSPWCTPVDPDVIARARAGDWQVILTPTRAVPAAWFGDLAGKDVLCLAAGGGQQAPVLAAAGARVTSFDLSAEQLARDRLVAERDGLSLRLLQGDMRDLAGLADASCDLVFNPVSVCFVAAVGPVWRECARVLRPGGRLLAGLTNPAAYLFDPDEARRTGALVARFRLPYAETDASVLTPARRAELDGGEALEFSHTLTDLIGGQLAAGLLLADLYEDRWNDAAAPLDPFMPSFVATLAIKP
jgi:SAM-dependent methyltransferase